MPTRALVLIALAASALGQARVQYAGGTIREITVGSQGALEASDDRYFAFYAKKSQVRVPYDRINLVEYGQQVSRRLVLAIAISPAFLLSKSRKHFLTVGYADENGNQQALVFRVDKNSIRATLVSLEARTGLKVQYQDEEARKAGRG